MELAPDLSSDALAAALPGRALRVYTAVVSTEADALAWARTGGPGGAVVVAAYQASPRGRGGLEWKVEPERTLAFSMIVRPELPAEREGWVYIAASCALADTLGPNLELAWPDDVRRAGLTAGAVGTYVEIGTHTVGWAVLNVLVPEPTQPRPELLRQVVHAVEKRLAEPVEEVLDDYRSRCKTLGAPVRARLVPMGPTGVVVEGHAVDVLANGALVVETSQGARAVVPPQSLGVLEMA